MLQPPAGNFLTLEGPPDFHDGLIEVDIGLTHPNDDAIFTGFDVCGTIISQGSIEASGDSSVLIPGPDDLHLLNPDGYTRWFNPTEFPYDAEHKMTGYVDGVMGTPDSSADYSATVNAYKYFADGDLDFDEAFGENVEIFFDTLGTFDVRLRVTNDEPAQDVSDPIQVVVGEPLEAIFTVVGDTDIYPGESIEFDASPSKTPTWTTITDYDWDIDGDEDFDDDHGINPHIVFPHAGDYWVKLRVTNSDLDQDVSDVYELSISTSTFWVDDDNTSGPWDGSESNPFETITDAIDASSDFGTIYVESGEYVEDIHLQKPLHIEGIGTTPPALITSFNLDDSGFKVSSSASGGSWENFSYTPRLAESTGNANTMIYLGWDGSLNGFDMDSISLVMPTEGDPTGQGILVVDGGTDINITDCEFMDVASNYVGQSGIVIDLRNCTNITLEENRLQDWSYGDLVVVSGEIDIKLLRIYNCNGVSLLKNLIGDVFFGMDDPLEDPIVLYGIYEEGSSDNITMRNNLLRRLLVSSATDVYPKYYGVYADGVGTLNYYQNTISAFGAPFVAGCYGYGVYFSNITTGDMYNNIIAHIFPPFVVGHTYGYYVDSGTLPVITYSDIFDGFGFNFTRLGGNATGGDGMLNANPEFVQNFTDQHLDTGSPCIGTGLGGYDMGCYGGVDPLPDW